MLAEQADAPHVVAASGGAADAVPVRFVSSAALGKSSAAKRAEAAAMTVHVPATLTIADLTAGLRHALVQQQEQKQQQQQQSSKATKSSTSWLRRLRRGSASAQTASTPCGPLHLFAPDVTASAAATTTSSGSDYAEQAVTSTLAKELVALPARMTVAQLLERQRQQPVRDEVTKSSDALVLYYAEEGQYGDEMELCLALCALVACCFACCAAGEAASARKKNNNQGAYTTNQYNPQQGQNYNPQQGQNYNPQQGQNYNPQLPTNNNYYTNQYATPPMQPQQPAGYPPAAPGYPAGMQGGAAYPPPQAPPPQGPVYGQPVYYSQPPQPQQQPTPQYGGINKPPAL